MKGQFEYVQDHSPQHSPCESKSTAYPGVRAKLATAIESSDTWYDRTEAGGGWHPQASVLTYMAVGHEDYCNDTYRQIWNLTGALQEERVRYATRTTVTVGLFSDDEGDAMGWRHYLNGSSSSPRLMLTYEGPPQVPALNSVVVNPQKPTVAGALVSNSSTVSLAARPLLEQASDPSQPVLCRKTTACVRAVFEVSSLGTVEGALVTATDTNLSVTGSLSLPPGTYSVRVKATNVDTGLSSAWSASTPLVVDLPPAAPVWSWVPPDGWTNPSSFPAGSPMGVAVTRQADAAAYCLHVLQDGVTTVRCFAAVAGAGPQVIDVGTFDAGQVEVSLTASDDYVDASSPYTEGSATPDTPAQRTFILS